MTSEIDKTARKIERKRASEIEETTREIETTCDRFIKFNENLIKSEKELDFKTKDKLEKIGRVLKNFYMKSSGIQETWLLNEEQFKEGRLERDSYERKLRELTEDISSLRFDYNKCIAEIEAFESKVSKSFGLTPYVSEPKIERKDLEQAEINMQYQEKVVSTEKEKLDEEKIEVKREDDIVDYPEAYIRLGLSYEESNKPEKAKNCFESALVSRPNNATIWFHLGHANSALGDYQEATRCYQKVLEINPEHTAALCDLGFSYGQLGKHKQAQKCYKRLVDINPNDAKAWTGLGVTLYSSSRFKQAKECMEKAIKIDPKLGLAWYNLGLVYSSLGYHQESKRCYEKAKKLGYS